MMTLAEYDDWLAKAGSIDGNIAEMIMGLHRDETLESSVAVCKDGEIEPKHCEYYGEPNGCNSPTYGEHPPTPNNMAMYGALLKVKRLFDGRIMFQQAIREAHEAVNAALAEPPRNCDLYTVGEALSKYGFPTKIKQWGEKEWLDFCEWLVSEAKGATDEQK